MTEQEAGMLIKTVKAVYPEHFMKYHTEDYKNLVRAWTVVLEDFTYEEASAGLKVYLRSDDKGFPPSPGQVATNIMKITEASNADYQQSALEAWATVRKAIQRSGYNAEEEFQKLPPLCQKVIGCSDNLHNMAMMKSDVVGSVEQSHFISCYNTELARLKEKNRMPQSVQKLIENTLSKSLEKHRYEILELEEETAQNGYMKRIEASDRHGTVPRESFRDYMNKRKAEQE